jgi:hypothetical protein
MSKADDLRKETTESGKRGDKTKSLKEGALEHKREKALNEMADNTRIGWTGSRSRKLKMTHPKRPRDPEPARQNLRDAV